MRTLSLLLAAATAHSTSVSQRDGETLGACSSSLDWCTNPDPELSQTNDHRCKGANPTACFSGLAQWQIDRVLEQHNKVRAKHGACPVTYSKEIEDWSVASEGFVNTCNKQKLEHNSDRTVNGAYVGENLYGASGYSELQDFDPRRGLSAWYCGEEGCWDYGTASGSGTTGHFTQVVWKESTEIGCALCHVKPGSGWTNIYFMCNYRVGGNYGGQYAANVGNVNEAASGCAPAPEPTPQPTPVPLAQTPMPTPQPTPVPLAQTPAPTPMPPAPTPQPTPQPVASRTPVPTANRTLPTSEPGAAASTPAPTPAPGSSGSAPTTTDSGAPTADNNSGMGGAPTATDNGNAGGSPSTPDSEGRAPTVANAGNGVPVGEGTASDNVTPSGSPADQLGAANDSGEGSDGTAAWVYVVAVLGGLVGVGVCAAAVMVAAGRRKPKVTLSGFYNELQAEAVEPMSPGLNQYDTDNMVL